jgi:hypothetical protein
VAVACIDEIRNAYKIPFGKPKVKTPFVGHRHRCEDNIKLDLK